MLRWTFKYGFFYLLAVTVVHPLAGLLLGRPYRRAMDRLVSLVVGTLESGSPASRISIETVMPESSRRRQARPRPGAGHPSLPEPSRRRVILSAALALVGARYRWGGEDDRGVDCSGLVVAAYRKGGLRLPHGALQLYLVSRPVPLAQLRPGDLLFFAAPAGLVDHVAIYLGGGRMVHASAGRQRVVIDDFRTRLGRKRFVRAGRVVRPERRESV